MAVGISFATFTPTYGTLKQPYLGSEYGGVLSSDDLNVYNGYPVFAQQKCLAHLRRHFERLTKLPGQNNQAIGQAFKDLIDEAFRHYHLWQQNHSGG